MLIEYSFVANGKSVDATQELLAIGASNIVNSFAQGFPGTGSLWVLTASKPTRKMTNACFSLSNNRSRGAVNNASGVRTPMGSLYTGVLVILALLFMTPLFFYIPKAALASIIIAAVIFMVEVRVIMPMWRRKSTFDSPHIILSTISIKFSIFFDSNRNRPGSWYGCIPCMSSASIGIRYIGRHWNKYCIYFVSCCPTEDIHWVLIGEFCSCILRSIDVVIF